MATASGRSAAPGRGSPVQARSVTVTGRPGSGVDFDAEPGGLLALAGPRGPERTALLLALGGRYRLRGGNLRVGGFALPGQKAAVRRHVAVARALHAFGPDPYDTVGELLSTAGAYAGRRADEAEVRYALERVGLDEPPLPRGARYGALAPLPRLLLAVALALVGRPSVLLVDAVDDGLDDDGTPAAWRALRRVADSGPTVLATCDSASAAASQAHHVVPLEPAAVGVTAPATTGGESR
ncbi:P-loop NTPase family protein [Phaeacidiphilus oryzae]|uniref:hypothetical protein n=1 Tax=Phaeacidiphilus oryzae TaxID=348818 RepID=UPI00068C3B46|nr:hypothetical protein [Phaeacidiphilus oryzae]